MNVIYNLETNHNPQLNTIFLAGPSHRTFNSSTVRWRFEATRLLEQLLPNQDFNVIVPEPRHNHSTTDFDKIAQIEWERKYLAIANIIVFWIPRSDTLPGFTTNIEFGEHIHNGKTIVGFPDDAIKMDYIRYVCKGNYSSSLADTMQAAADKLSRLPKTFFTSDTHFGSARTLEFSRRPFDTTQEMDTQLISNWNGTVYAQDTVYHLGDFGEPSTLDDLSFNKLHLLLGNHDTTGNMQTYLETNDNREVEIIQNEHEYEDIKLIHEPEVGTNPSSFYLYGHIHQLQMVKRNGFNVGTDCHRFTPIDDSVVKFYRNAIVKHYDKNVFMEQIG